MARMIKLTDLRVAELEKWLALNRIDKPYNCPISCPDQEKFGTITYWNRCREVCGKIFPSLTYREKPLYPFDSKDVFCPCMVLTLNYITRTARKLIKENKNEKSIHR